MFEPGTKINLSNRIFTKMNFYMFNPFRVFYLLRIFYLSLGIYAIKLIEEDKGTLLDYLSMARMAYEPKNTAANGLFNYRNAEGLVAKVYKYKKTIVVAFKGTALLLFGYPIGETAQYDKTLIDLAFTCCVDEIGCEDTKRKLLENTLYFKDSLILLDEIKQAFPDKHILLTGHSLGGAIATRLATMTGLQAFAFSTPGDSYFLKILNEKNKQDNILHVGMCNDPIYTGKCVGMFSPCKLAGYNLETRCHFGKAYCIRANLPLGIISHTSQYLQSNLAAADELEEMDEEGCVDCQLQTENVHIQNLVFLYSS